VNGDQLTLALLEDERLGAAERELVACLLSRWLSGLTDERLAALHMLVRALRLWGSTAVYVDGELAPVRCEGISSWPVRAPESAMVRKGLTRSDIDELWRDAEQRHGLRAHLPMDLLESLVPIDFWRVILAFVEDGPIVASIRLVRALDAEGRRVKPPTPRHPQGRLVARGTLDGYRGITRRLMHTTVELHAAGYDHDALASWVHVPRATPIRGGRTDVARPAPTLLHMRQVWRWWADNATRRYGAALLELPAAVERMSPRQLRAAGPIALKNLVLLTLFLLTGGRLGALSRLRRGDFEQARMMQDGTTSPVILLQPRKRTDSSIVRPKALPLEAAALVRAWLILAERHYGWVTSSDDPLFPGLKPGRAMAYSSYRKALMGNYGGKKPGRAIVPKHIETLGKRPPSLPSSCETLRITFLLCLRARTGVCWDAGEHEQWGRDRFASASRRRAGGNRSRAGRAGGCPGSRAHRAATPSALQRAVQA
jgi:hypothetical protein